MPTIGESLAAQFARCWEMLRDVVHKTPEDRWLADGAPGQWLCAAPHNCTRR